MAKTEQYREQLIEKLRQMFMMDQSDLDFGIYRIMNAKRGEVESFLTKDLLPTIRQSLEAFQPAEFVELNKELTEIDKSPGKFSQEYVDDVKAKLEGAQDISRLEEEVYSHLLTFFSRYYDGGDFMSLRRYKEETYSPIPFNGEEVKLHWANADQYYIKSAERFQSYTFKTKQGRVRFELATATTERDNNKAAAGKERRFILSAENTLLERDSDLIICFEYRGDEEKRNQKSLNQLAIKSLLELSDSSPLTTGLNYWGDWRKALLEKVPTEKNPNRSLLEKHLNDYTAKNSFDYFIHKNLRKFLRRELDFFIKNEVMHLDDIENESVPKVEQYLAKIKTIRQIAHKLIDFLAQLENFQKKLWLKKKLVFETNWLVTLDKVPEELYSEIIKQAENPVADWSGVIRNQREEWVKLFAISEVKDDLAGGVKYSIPLTESFLKENTFLVLDTIFFDQSFKDKLIEGIDDIDCAMDGLVMHCDNFQGLKLIQNRYRNHIGCIYIDPPYNTDATPILYKNGYKDSSWLTLITDRIIEAKKMLDPEIGAICVAIDDTEVDKLSTVLKQIFPEYDLFKVIVNHYPGSGTGRSNVTRTHEYALFLVPKGKDILRGDSVESGERIRNFRRSGTGENNYRTGRPNSFYAVLVDPGSNEIVGVEKPPEGKDYLIEDTENGLKRLYPIGQDGSERCWSLSYESAGEAIESGVLIANSNGVINRLYQDDERRNLLPSMWIDKKFSAVSHGTNLLKNMFGDGGIFSYPKSLYTVDQAIDAITYANKKSIVLDFFSGSSTTAHAVIMRNKKDGGNRKYILLEQGEYFREVTLNRIIKSIYSDSWSAGRPNSIAKRSHFVKYMHIESYEDCSNSLNVKRTESQQKPLDTISSVRQDYLLSYMLDVESRDSLMNLEKFIDPFNVVMNIARNDDTHEARADMVETFNYLLGLRIKTQRRIRGVYEVIGTMPTDENALVLWRNVNELGSDALDEWFKKQAYSSRDTEFDVIYINGDNNIENLRRSDETWKVRLIEESFHRLMFDTQDA